MINLKKDPQTELRERVAEEMGKFEAVYGKAGADLVRGIAQIVDLAIELQIEQIAPWARTGNTDPVPVEKFVGSFPHMTRLLSNREFASDGEVLEHIAAVLRARFGQSV